MSEEAFKMDAVPKLSLASAENLAKQKPNDVQATHIVATAVTTGAHLTADSADSTTTALKVDNFSSVARNDSAFATTVVERPNEPTSIVGTTALNNKSSQGKKSTVASTVGPAVAAGEQRGRTKTRSRRRSSLIEDGSPEKVAAQKQRRTGRFGNAVENVNAAGAASGKTTEPTNRRATRSTAPLTALPVPLTLEDDDPNLFSPMTDDNVGDFKNDVLDDLARTLVMLKDSLWASVHKDVSMTTTATTAAASSSTTTANNNSNRIHMKSNTLKSNTLKFHRKVAKGAILRASKLVSTALQTGTWPSPYCTFVRSQSIDANNDSTASARVSASKTTNNSSTPASSPSVFVCDNQAHDAHMTKVADSIDLLTTEIIQPNVLQELKQAYDPTVHTDENQLESRAFLGTLLLLREVLMQNKVEIFGPDPEESEDLPNSSQRSLDDSSRGGGGTTRDTCTARTGTAHWTPCSIISRQILATTVILTGLGEVDDDGQLSGDLCDAFLDLAETYEYVVAEMALMRQKVFCLAVKYRF
jgi:hypothetical protein